MALTTEEEDRKIELLDASAEQIAEQHAFSDSDSSEYNSQEAAKDATSESDSSEDDPELARAAAALPSGSPPPKRRKVNNSLNSANNEEEEVTKKPSWQDLEDARRFLTQEHQKNFLSLIERLERQNIDAGDDVDLNTGLIVRSTGHLQALAPQPDLQLFDLSDNGDEGSDDEASMKQDESDDEFDSTDGDEFAIGDNASTFGVDPAFTVCQKPAKLLNSLVEMSRQRWIL